MSTPQHSSYITLEPPDLVYWRLVGRVEAADVERIYAEQLAFVTDKPYVLVMVDVTDLEQMTPDARRVAAEGPNKRTMPVRGSVVIGASFHFRVLGMLVNKAAQFMHRNEDNPMHFVNTVAEARAWLEERRRQLQKI